MLNTLACTIFMTLCVDAGWKPLDDGSKVYVIQIRPEQGTHMIQNGEFITSEIPDGVKEVRVQFGNDTLVFELPTPSNPLPPHPAPIESPTHVIPTSMNSPPSLPQPKNPLTVKKADEKNTTPDEKQESYLTTAILSWIISAAFFAMVVYLVWIHFDMRRRYQLLLNRTLTDPTVNPLSPSNIAGIRSVAPLTTFTKDPTLPSRPTPLPESPQSATCPERFSQDTLASASEAPPEKSTLEESEIYDLPDVEGDLDINFDKTDRLLENTNRIIAQATLEKERAKERVKEATSKTPEPEEIETVFELPETSDDELPEEGDDTKNWEGVE